MSELPHYGHVIDGVEEYGEQSFDSVDPWTRRPWARVALGGPAEADRAVAAARRAFDEGPWPRLGFEERGRILHGLADLVEREAGALAAADTHDMGKPTRQAHHDVGRTARNLRFFADHARLSVAEALPMEGHHAYTQYGPAGVAVAISPWNFPLMLASWKVAPALAWGNPVVLKPSEDAPVSATLLARLALEAGVPPGVLNVVHGYGSSEPARHPRPSGVGQALVADPRVDRVTFTGSSATGRAIAAAAGANLTPVSLELGGKGANLVFADADLDNALGWSLRAIFQNSGQVCLAGSRLYVQRQVYDEFLARFVEAAAAMRIGAPTGPETEIGPLSSERHFSKVAGYVDTVTEAGGKVLTGGRAEGWVVAPTVVAELPGEARHWQEEIFGPVVVVASFDTEAEAVAAANDTPYGLNAMLFTEDLHRAHRVAGALRAGTVWVNCFFVRDLRAPFGGVGDSGIGREGGTFSREFFTEPKAVVMQLKGVQ